MRSRSGVPKRRRRVPVRRGKIHVWANTEFRSVGPKSVFARDATARVRVGHASAHPVAFQKGGQTAVAVGSCHDQALTTPLHLGGLLEADQTFTVRQYSSKRGAWGAEETAKGSVLADLGVRIEAKGYHILEFRRAPRAGSRGRGGRR